MADVEGAQTAAPDDSRYSEEHEWARPQDGGSATIGITDYAAHELGDVVFVQLPAVGTSIKQFEKLGEIESVKAVSDLFAPVSGEITEVNEALLERPELVNEDAFEGGWMLRVRMTDPAELDRLMDAQAYRQHLASASSE